MALVASRGGCWHGKRFSVWAETLVGPVAGKEGINRKMTGIRLKLADAVNKDRCRIGHKSLSAREGFKNQCCSYRPNPHLCWATLVSRREKVALPNIFYSVIDSRTLISKKAAGGYDPEAPSRERCSLRSFIGRGGKGSI